MSDGIILVVDDEPANRELLEGVLLAEGYTVIAVESASAAQDVLARTLPDVVLLDVMMPGMDGIELCRLLKSQEATRLVPVVLITSLNGTEDRVCGIEAGADDFLSKPFRVPELRARMRSLVRLKRYTDQLDHAETVLYSLALGVEAKDPRLEGHCVRLAHYAAALGAALGVDQPTLDLLRRGGVLHDLGKIGIPDAILFKPGPLSPDEWTVMREHPVIGERICQPLRTLQDVLPMIRHHHERWNGTGYPDGLAGQAIPLTARILQVGDVFDALTTRRPYRRPLPPSEALDVLMGEVARGYWDPRVVETFARIWADGALRRDDGTAGNIWTPPMIAQPFRGWAAVPAPPGEDEESGVQTGGTQHGQGA